MPCKEKAKSKPRKTRGPRGQGTVFWSDAKGCYVGRRVVGRSAAGKTLYVHRQGKTQKAVVRALAAAGPPGPGVTFGNWARRWAAGLDLRPSTLASYRASVRNHLVPHLGRRPVRDITPHDVARAAAAWARVPGPRGKPLGPNTVRTVLAHLRDCLAEAVRAGLRPDNPVSLAKKPKAVRKKIDPFTPAELSAVVAAAAARPNLRAVALMAATGCRVGEALGLDVPDWDPAAGTVAITKTLGPKRESGPPKSERGTRTIRVPAGRPGRCSGRRGGGGWWTRCSARGGGGCSGGSGCGTGTCTSSATPGSPSRSPTASPSPTWPGTSGTPRPRS